MRTSQENVRRNPEWQPRSFKLVQHCKITHEDNHTKFSKQNLRLIFFTFICAEVQVLVSVCITQEVYVDTVFRFYGSIFFHCLVGCFSTIVWTHAVLSVLSACVLYFCICTCSAQLNMFYMEKCSRNTLIIIIIIISSSSTIVIKTTKKKAN